MSSKAGSRWSQAESDTADYDRNRKQEKRRLREEKARKVQAEQISRETDYHEEQDVHQTKRTRLQTAQPVGDTREGLVTTLPQKGFGPCPSIQEYEILNAIEEGSYGKVSRAKNKSTGAIVAVKKLKLDNPSEGFPVTGLREIQTLRACSGANVVKLIEVAMGNLSQE